MSLGLLKYIAKQEKLPVPTTRERIIDEREKWDKGFGTPVFDYEHHQHVDTLLGQLKDEGLIDYKSSAKQFVLTEKGKKVSEILLEKQEPTSSHPTSVT